MTSHYDPSQPRVPAGHHDGGQWTSQGRPPEPISKTGDVEANQTPADAESRPEELISQPARLKLPAVKLPAVKLPPTKLPPVRPPETPIGEIVLGLFGAFSKLNDPNRRAVLDFRAREYIQNSFEGLNEKNVRVLDRDEVGKACPGLPDIQKLTDVAMVLAQAKDPSLRSSDPAAFGTRVHTKLRNLVRSGALAREGSFFFAEESFRKMTEETPATRRAELDAAIKDNDFKKFVRIDVYEHIPGKQTLCVYDIKTGQSGLSKARMDEIHRFIRTRFGPDTRIIITQIRPGQGGPLPLFVPGLR